MSKSIGEYRMSMVGSKSACGGYANLHNYNGSSSLVPNRSGGASGVQIVPVFGAPGYDSLQLGGGCGGYPGVMDAYGQNAGSCNTKFVQRMCGDLLGQTGGYVCNKGDCQQIHHGTQRVVGQKVYPNESACSAQCHSSK